MKKYLEDWAIGKVLGSFSESAGSIPSYVSIGENEIRNHLDAPDLRKIDAKILDFGFYSLGIMHLENWPNHAVRDVFQKIYLNESGEVMYAWRCKNLSPNSTKESVRRCCISFMH